MQTETRKKSAVVRTIHEHSILDAYVDDLGLFAMCKCEQQFDSFSTHADHVAMKVLDAFEEIDAKD